MDITKLLSHQTSIWYQTATPKDISYALEVGYQSLSYLKTNQLSHPQSTTKGSFGENYIYDMLSREFSNVVVVAKTAASGDIHIRDGGALLIVEVKNYGHIVPTSEVTKFTRDIINTKSNAAMMISLCTPIIGFNKTSIVCENHNSQIVPCAYVLSSDEAVIISTARLLLQMSQILSSINLDQVDNNQFIQNIIKDVDKFSKVRKQIQSELMNAVDKLINFSTDAARLEHTINYELSRLTPDLVTISANVIENISKIPNYNSLDLDLKYAVTEIIKRISNTKSVWKCGQKKCEHSTSHIQLVFNISPIIQIPRKIIHMPRLFELISLYKINVKIADNIKMSLDTTVCAWILEMIDGGHILL